jgi:hypothetical protein
VFQESSGTLNHLGLLLAESSLDTSGFLDWFGALTYNGLLLISDTFSDFGLLSLTDTFGQIGLLARFAGSLTFTGLLAF